MLYVLCRSAAGVMPVQLPCKLVQCEQPGTSSLHAAAACCKAALAHLQLGHTGASSQQLHCVQVSRLQVVALHDALQGRSGALKEVACMAARVRRVSGKAWQEVA